MTLSLGFCNALNPHNFWFAISFLDPGRKTFCIMYAARRISSQIDWSGYLAGSSPKNPLTLNPSILQNSYSTNADNNILRTSSTVSQKSTARRSLTTHSANDWHGRRRSKDTPDKTRTCLSAVKSQISKIGKKAFGACRRRCSSIKTDRRRYFELI